MKTMFFASRNTKEILRDKLNLAFGLSFPIILLLLLSAIQANIPVKLFEIKSLVPGAAVFGLSFISLFSGLLIAKDRTGSFLLRLFTSPLTAENFIFGYTLPLLPIAAVQVAICFVCAFFLGLKADLNALLAVIVLLPAALMFIGIGLLCGSLFTDKQVGGVCGALLINLSAWLSDAWFKIDLVGGAFKAVAEALPFVHATRVGRAALAGNYAAIFPDLLWVIGYAVVIMVVAAVVFMNKMKEE
ncbi:ABC transporter permease [Ktedonosporobacter rubrisoli]|uniref:Transport permease protein n=1 Tax=Ktedonosporobacter rubrisoli TaxID=2509675 RepID=A0A4P6JK70_KTERU|nr:ABC transporter permease [Ktedonosporobacter rubrisoli]QBD75026.1 ABC transporter permease [Ktedonosporobacter rubrisoli]